MYDIKMDGKKRAPAWFWIALALIVIASIIAYIVFQNDNRKDQLNTEKQTTFLQAANGKL
jgi:bacteriorhodopsin